MLIMALAKTDPVLEYESSGFDASLQASPMRWVMAGMLLIAAVLNYLDRSILGILIPTIQKDLSITDGQYAHVVDGFLAAYTFSYLFSGRLVDKLGSRLGMALFVGCWSIANGLTGFARSLMTLALFRGLLGLSEAGGYTASPKAVAEWFVPKERAFAIGLYSIGGSIGATIAPLLVVFAMAHFGWQSAFAITGGIGLIWIIPWLIVSRQPREVTEAASSLDVGQPISEWDRWRSVLAQPAVWQLMCARLLTDGVWYFYLFWFPKYLHDSRGVSQAGLGILWVVFLASDFGFLSGGFLSDRLVGRGNIPSRSRVYLLIFAALLIPVSALVPLAPSVKWVLAAASVVAFAHCIWLGNLTALVVDLAPKPTLATAFGFIAAGSAAGGIIMNELVAWTVRSYSFDRAFIAMACLHPLALILVWSLRKPQRDGIG
jgi:MFS transporter, ACS family, hexuronate transporter